MSEKPRNRPRYKQEIDSKNQCADNDWTNQ